jgi:hypothetical protein
VLKAKSAGGAILGGGGNFRRWGIAGRNTLLEDMMFKGTLSPLPLPIISFFFLATRK